MHRILWLVHHFRLSGEIGQIFTPARRGFGPLLAEDSP
jgi:hypothetical protein